MSERAPPVVLVIAAHPDDEVLGCGGSIARHREQGHNVSVLILADGISSRVASVNDAQPEKLAERQQCAYRANAILGVSDLTMLSYPDNRMDGIELLDVVQDIERHIKRCQPTIIYTHHSGDVNIDHRIAHDAVIAACRPQPGHSVRQLLFFETPSSTEWLPSNRCKSFVPNWFTDISGNLTVKLKALAAYSSELREFPHPRSLQAVEYLARWRGATVGVVAAEAFMLGRMIQ